MEEVKHGDRERPPYDVAFVGTSSRTAWLALPGVTKKILEDTLRRRVIGMVHCSGGVQTKILHFLSAGLHVVKDNMLPTQPVFRLIQEQSRSSWEEMYKVFNVGHRMEFYDV